MRRAWLQVLGRVDCHFATPELAALAQRADLCLTQKFGDPAPLAEDKRFEF